MDPDKMTASQVWEVADGYKRERDAALLKLDEALKDAERWKQHAQKQRGERNTALIEKHVAESRLDEQSKQLAHTESMSRGWQDKLYDVEATMGSVRAAVQRCDDSDDDDKPYQLWRYLRELLGIAEPCADAWHTYHKPGTSCGSCGVVERLNPFVQEPPRGEIVNPHVIEDVPEPRKW
jgi:hypothetical protein